MQGGLFLASYVHVNINSLWDCLEIKLYCGCRSQLATSATVEVDGTFYDDIIWTNLRALLHFIRQRHKNICSWYGKVIIINLIIIFFDKQASTWQTCGECCTSCGLPSMPCSLWPFGDVVLKCSAAGCEVCRSGDPRSSVDEGCIASVNILRQYPVTIAVIISTLTKRCLG